MCTRLFCSRGKKYVIQDKVTSVPAQNGTVRKAPRPVSFLPPSATARVNDAADRGVEIETPKKEAPLTPPPDIAVNDKPVSIDTLSIDTLEEKRSSEDVTESKISINPEPTKIEKEEEARGYSAAG